MKKLFNYFKSRKAICMKYGSSMDFIGRNYHQGDINKKLNINDRVIIHPVMGHSQATKDYPGKVVAHQVKGRDGRASGLIWVLMVKGILDNKEWEGAWINDYYFGRLELVSRNYKGD